MKNWPDGLCPTRELHGHDVETDMKLGGISSEEGQHMLGPSLAGWGAETRGGRSHTQDKGSTSCKFELRTHARTHTRTHALTHTRTYTDT